MLAWVPSVCLSIFVSHKSVSIEMGGWIKLVFGMEASFNQSYTVV